MGISVQKAFGLRNRIKKAITELDNQLSKARKSYVEGESENVRLLSGLTCEEALKKSFSLKDSLMNLNIAIDKSNVDNISLVHKIRTVDVKIKQLKSIFSELKDINETTQVKTGERDEHGYDKYVTKNLIPTFQWKDIMDQAAELDKGKQRLEETLAEKNHTVMVDFDPSTVQFLN